MGLATKVVVELDFVPIELVRLHHPVGLGNAGRTLKVLFSLVLEVADWRSATALIAVEKRAATACFVACRVDSVVTAMVVRADNSLSKCAKKSVALPLIVEGEIWNTLEYSVVVEMHFVPVSSAAQSNLASPGSTTN